MNYSKCSVLINLPIRNEMGTELRRTTNLIIIGRVSSHTQTGRRKVEEGVGSAPDWGLESMKAHWRKIGTHIPSLSGENSLR